MVYNKLGSTEPRSSSNEQSPIQMQENPSSTSLSHSTTSLHRKLILLLSVVLILASAISLSFLLVFRAKPTTPTYFRTPTAAVSRVCSRTRYPTLCVNSLLDHPDSGAAGELDLVHISLNTTLSHFSRALYVSSEISGVAMDASVRAAYEDCLELLDESIDQLNRSMRAISTGSAHDVLTWLSAAMTNQDTCNEGLDGMRGYVRDVLDEKVKDLSKMVSNCLAIYAAAKGVGDFEGVPVTNGRRRRLMDSTAAEVDHRYPAWLSRRERELLETPVAAIKADVVVAKDGNGTCKTILEAIKKAPENGTRRFIIYVKAGRYEENNLKVGRKKMNLMFIGDGRGKTVISGGKSVADNMTTFHTATFAATGTGFMARDITFENWAGPVKHQAVALRVGSDHAVVYRCNIIGYQDTLYVHSNRQFFRECAVYGTVDFIFGNAAVVFQNCSMYARKPMPFQKVTYTAQNRKTPDQNSGMSLHDCKFLATPDLLASRGNFSTYLGRPWKMYSRTVIMMSYIGDHVHYRGWLEWNATFALDTLYYGEYMNYGPGAALGRRVNWTGYHNNLTAIEASKFTVAKFILGTSWLPSTGVTYLSGLSV